MNAKLLTAISAAAATTALIGMSAPANAYSFGTSGINFQNNTTVNFGFTRSQGAYQSSLGVYEVLNKGGKTVLSQVATLFSEVKASDNGRANEWRGTLGNTVLGTGKASFNFLAGKVYTLGLTSTNPIFSPNSVITPVYSTSALNTKWGGSQQAVFGSNIPLNNTSTKNFANAGNFNAGNLLAGKVQIGFDDRGNGNDKDFQDFQVTAEVPEPTTMAGMALGAAGLAAARRRRAAKKEDNN